MTHTDTWGEKGLEIPGYTHNSPMTHTEILGERGYKTPGLRHFG